MNINDFLRQWMEEHQSESERWREAPKSEFLDALCGLLRMTSCAGHPQSNPIAKIQYIKTESGDEIARPVFEDGTGANGYYDVNISGDSNIAILYDIVDKFIRRVW